MGRFVNPDSSAFQVALNSRIYVDKTGLIEYTNSVLDTTNAYICNSRPRRFGKSYAANMLAAYYSKGTDSEQMFSGLRISKDADFKKHLNKYDVIHIDIQWFLANCDDADKVVSFITKSVLDELRGIYPDALPQEVVTLPDALSRVKERTGQKFVVFYETTGDVQLSNNTVIVPVKKVMGEVEVKYTKYSSFWSENPEKDSPVDNGSYDEKVPLWKGQNTISTSEMKNLNSACTMGYRYVMQRIGTTPNAGSKNFEETNIFAVDWSNPIVKVYLSDTKNFY